MSGPLVVFVGPMGSGKTRLGKRVARALDAPFTDTDKVIVAEHGPIATIFDEHGESRFRALERAAVHEALTREGVVSLGGGAILDADTRAELAALPVVSLGISADAVAERLGDGKRPLVRGGIADWQRIYDARRELYAEVAGLTLDTSHRPFEALVGEVLAWLETR